jgi:hypothetical protein
MISNDASRKLKTRDGKRMLNGNAKKKLDNKSDRLQS